MVQGPAILDHSQNVSMRLATVARSKNMHSFDIYDYFQGIMRPK